MTLPIVFTLKRYPVPTPRLDVGSFGKAGMYVGVRHERSSPVEVATPLNMLELATVRVGHVYIPKVPSKIPLLSAILCPTAFRIVFKLLVRWLFLAWANCLAGLIATITIAASIAIIPITTRISISVNPEFIFVFFIFTFFI